MVSYLLPSVQKRLLRYALSKLELLDTDALDLEHLDIVWGTKSTLEFRNVGLRLKKLETLLQLPPSFDLAKARVLLLRVTIPVDIYRSPIVVEVDGVEGHLKIASSVEKGDRSKPSRGSSDGKRRKTRPSAGDSREREHSTPGLDAEEEPALPTAADLATSFLQTEPLEEKAQLERELLSRPQDLAASIAQSDDGEDDMAIGTGTGLALPAFMTNFLQGIVDRLQVRIRQITSDVDVDLTGETLEKPSMSAPVEVVTVQIKVDDINIQGVTSEVDPNDDENRSTSKAELKKGKRLVSLQRIRGCLISEANVFAALARSKSSVPSSPSVAHSEASDARRSERSYSMSKSRSIIDDFSGETESIVQSKHFSEAPNVDSHLTSSVEIPLSSSVVTSDSVRFEDPPEDSHSSGAESARHGQASNYGDSVFEDSAYLDQLTNSQFDEPDDDDENDENPSKMFFKESPRLPSDKSAMSTPRASIYGFDSFKRTGNPSQSVLSLRQPRADLQSSILPVREQHKLADLRVSRSQPVSKVLPSKDQIQEDIEGSESSKESAIDEIDGGNGKSNNSSPLEEDDLAQSRLFSHEDAESMYMSAISHPSIHNTIGSWHGQDNISSAVSREDTLPATHSSEVPSQDNLEHAVHELTSMGQNTSDLRLQEMSSPDRPLQFKPQQPKKSTGEFIVRQGQEAEEAIAPVTHTKSGLSEPSSTSSQDYSRLAKQVFDLDQIRIYLPSPEGSALKDGDNESEDNRYNKVDDSQVIGARSVMRDLPGAFSTHLPEKKSTTQSISTSDKSKSDTDETSIEVILGQMNVMFDVSVARMLWNVVSLVRGTIKGTPSAVQPTTKSEGPLPSASQRVKILAEEISVKFLERLAGKFSSSESGTFSYDWAEPAESDVLLRTTLKELDIRVDTSKDQTRTAVNLHKFSFGYARENIMSFDAALRMRSSVRDLASSSEVDMSMIITQSESVTRVKMDTLPLHVSIDLQRLDETFSWFGGLSSVLNMGSSMASNATMTPTAPPKVAPRSKGVRFDSSIMLDDPTMAIQNKTDVRIGGFVLDLIGKECSIGIETTAVKIVSRDEGLGVAIDIAKLSGPHLRSSNDDSAIAAEVKAIRVEYLVTPKDVDMDRLLSLITPSKAKYDQDDDILLDTLLRQRRQGSVVRVTVEGFTTRVGKLEEFSYLPELGEEISRLSTVAKYLPEDDRPGLLALILVRKAEISVDVDNRIGSFQLAARDFEAAHITFPILMAANVDGLTLHRNHLEELVGVATDVALREPKHRSPCIMARMIGDEMEPIVKIKLWNLRVDYNVATLMAIMNLSSEADGDDLAARLSVSVASLTDRIRSVAPKVPSAPTPRPKAAPSKPLTIDVVLRDCILGLNPLKLPSKVLLVMTEAHVSAVLPHDKNTTVTSETKKASLLVIDDVANITKAALPSKSRRQSFDGGSNQVADLCSMGFVSVSYISSAKAIVVIRDGNEDESKTIEVELRDDLLVVESCADSTQTLVATLSGLAPPMPPSKDVKYRTEIVPVTDLLASLSGEAFATAEGEYDFDADFGEDVGLYDENLSTAGTTHELSVNSQFFEQQSDDLFNADDMSDYGAVGSIASARLSSRDTNDGVLLESFHEGHEIIGDEQLDFREDHFGSGSIIEGTAHRWNSARNAYDKSNKVKVSQSPLKVCVRDVHIIWNLFDGYDWQHTRDVINRAVQDVESKAIEKRARLDTRSTFDQDIEDEETVIGDFLFNSIYIGIPSNRDPRGLAAAINNDLNDNATETESIATTSYSSSPSRPGSSHRSKGKRLRLRRSRHHKITFELKGINVDFIAFPENSGETQNSLDVRVRDLEIFDHVPTSTWKKFATYMHDAGERESGASQAHIELLTVKPVAGLAASEIVMKVTILPLRLHVDQDALDFITRFFEFKPSDSDAADSSNEAASSSNQPFLQRVEVNSIPVKLDFKPKRVDYAGLRSGHTTEFMNFLVLDQADMTLRHTIVYGTAGFENLGKTLNAIWMPDIKRNQLPQILAGIAPVRSLVNVGGGVRDLVVVPIREYRKDGRVVRSLAKGVTAFAGTTGTELVKLGAKIAVSTQSAVRSAEEMLTAPGRAGSDAGPSSSSSTARQFSTSPSSAAAHSPLRSAGGGGGSDGEQDDDFDEAERRHIISPYSNAPHSLAAGFKTAYAGLGRDLAMARNAIIAISGEVVESESARGAVGAVVRGAPTVVLKPVEGVVGAVGVVLLGAVGTLDSEERRRVGDKYKRY